MQWIKESLLKIKARIKHFIFLKKLKADDARRKKQIASEIYNIPSGLIDKKICNDDIIVSVTSYGARVSDTLPYMLYSMLKQTQLPHKVVVYLDEEHWSDEALPILLKEMQRIGVDFCYCEDLRSYKKLIPALQMFPDNPILIFDDDFYYHSDYFQWMLDAYKKSDKKTVIGGWGCIPEKRNGKYIPYNEWKDCAYATPQSPISFYCGFGTLFPPHIFDEEIFKKEIFMNLCPTADDIWFWVMMERLGIKRTYLKYKGYWIHRVVNKVEDYEIKNSDNLTKINVEEGRNDQQLFRLLQYYHLG